MTNTEMKTIADATVDFSRKATETMTEVSSRAFKDVSAYAETITKAQTEMFRSYPHADVFSGMLTTWTKMQLEMAKGYTQWADTYRSTFTK